MSFAADELLEMAADHRHEADEYDDDGLNALADRARKTAGALEFAASLVRREEQLLEWLNNRRNAPEFTTTGQIEAFIRQPTEAP